MQREARRRQHTQQ